MHHGAPCHAGGKKINWDHARLTSESAVPFATDRLCEGINPFSRFTWYGRVILGLHTET